ncbi:MAG: L-aspartate oxidase [Dehalococcoidia bacterium]|nr:L-aspartate oxidase [Dehalococcoidia bacterium]MCB9485367.1 L-aspartate oxidase [Thermoflexaceae bacterium]
MKYRVIVIGSGISGLFVALETRHLGPVLVLTKGSIDDCNTKWAQGGIAAAVGALDSFEQHLADTIVAGAGLVDADAARILCEEAPARIADLVQYGVSFDEIEGVVSLGKEAAHGQNRILHAGGDRTGAAIETALSFSTQQAEITVFDYSLATRLLAKDGRVVGVEALDLQSGQREEYFADAVVIATGGAGQLYDYTTNPDIATGDGIALAFEAGAEVSDLEFYQFHPTALRLEGAPPFLISEAVRGEGAVLRNAAGDAFMPRYHKLADLAPRDVVARAIVREMRAASADHVVLDCTGLHGMDVAARFPGIYSYCHGQGIDMRTTPIPVAPAAHYMMGGIRTDTMGRTTVAGLYACGECACTGVHGANRLASNSLMETVVFGKRVAEDLARGETPPAPQTADAIVAPEVLDGAAGDHTTIRSLMWDAVGIERDGTRLRAALERLSATAPETGINDDARTRRDVEERRGMSSLARLMTRAALQREESRGGHYRRDFPETDDLRWKRHQVFRNDA